MTKEDFEFYVSKHKEHEKNRTSTNDRNKFWKEHNGRIRADKETSRDN